MQKDVCTEILRMKSLNPIPVIGVPASPYTRKMVALLRYRRIPYIVEWGDARELIKKHNLEAPKPVLLPVMILKLMVHIKQSLIPRQSFTI